MSSAASFPGAPPLGTVERIWRKRRERKMLSNSLQAARRSGSAGCGFRD
jgi:hypothetical protein